MDDPIDLVQNYSCQDYIVIMKYDWEYSVGSK